MRNKEVERNVKRRILVMNNTLSRGLKDTEAAELLGLHPQTLRNMRCKGEGPAYHKLGRAVRYLEKDLSAYLEKRKIQTEG